MPPEGEALSRVLSTVTSRCNVWGRNCPQTLTDGDVSVIDDFSFFSPFSNYSIMRFNSFNDKQNYLRITIAKWEIKTLQLGQYAKTQNKKMQHVIKRQLPVTPPSLPTPPPQKKENRQRRDERVLPNRHVSKHPAIIWMGAQPQKESSPCRFCTEAPLLTSPLRKMEKAGRL